MASKNFASSHSKLSIGDISRQSNTFCGKQQSTTNKLYVFMREAATAVARLSHRNLSVRLSVCPSHGWISQKRCKLGLPNLYRRLPGKL